MRWWAFPTLSGDLRCEAVEGSDAKTRLTAENPTPVERAVLKRLGEELLGLDTDSAALCEVAGRIVREADDLAREKFAVTVGAPVVDIGARILKLLHQRPHGVLTAVTLSGGRVVTTEAFEPKKLPRWLREAEAQAKSAGADAAKATTVKRPTLSCPECSGRPEPRRCRDEQVLDAFLTPSQRADWARHRAILVVGGRTGIPYRVSGRDTPTARKLGRITFDLQSRCVLHHHDWSVPPAEEVLSVKLILEHREHWLRVFGEVDDFNAPQQFASPFLPTDNFLPATLQQSFWRGSPALYEG